VPSRKRRVVYPPPRTQTRQPRPGEPGGVGGPPAVEYVRPTVASINLSAGAGRAGLKVGDRVRITGNGLYSGELATIDKLASGGVIPSAVVRTDAGRTRQVRTIDLEPVVGAAPTAPAGPTPALPEPAASAPPDEPAEA
jgi:hypothetical protein